MTIFFNNKVKIYLIKKVRQKLHMPIAIMLDTKGPEYRIKTFENGKIELKDGDTFTLTPERFSIFAMISMSSPPFSSKKLLRSCGGNL